MRKILSTALALAMAAGIMIAPVSAYQAEFWQAQKDGQVEGWARTNPQTLEDSSYRGYSSIDPIRVITAKGITLLSPDMYNQAKPATFQLGNVTVTAFLASNIFGEKVVNMAVSNGYETSQSFPAVAIADKDVPNVVYILEVGDHVVTVPNRFGTQRVLYGESAGQDGGFLAFCKECTITDWNTQHPDQDITDEWLTEWNNVNSWPIVMAKYQGNDLENYGISGYAAVNNYFSPTKFSTDVGSILNDRKTAVDVWNAKHADMRFSGSCIPCTYSTTGTAPTFFTDVPESSWFYNYVKGAYDKGLINGMGDGTFAPQGSLTIAQTLVLAYQLNSKISTVSLGESRNGAWWAPYYSYCVNNGIISEQQFPSYTVDRPATRYEVVCILDNAISAGSKGGASYQLTETDIEPIPDLGIEDPNAAVVYKWYRAGILKGDEQRRFNGGDNITRAEMSVILCNVSSLFWAG